MIPVINDITRLLQAADSRYGDAYAPELRLSASAPAFVVALDATVTPASIVFIASREGIGAGPVEFTTDTGVPLAVAGDVATLLPAAMVGPACTVTVRQMWQGQQYVDRRTVLKTLAFDASKPPAPAGLAAVGALASIKLDWAATNNTNIGKVEVWRALGNNLAAAVAVGETAGLARTWTDNIGAAGAFYYWIRYISKANVPGPFNAQAGTLGTTGTAAEHLLELLQNEITESQLFGDLRDRIDLVDAEGTGLVDRVDALVETYGDTASSAESAVAAAEASEAAIAAKAAAILAAGDSAGAATASQTSRLAAETANKAAGTSASAAATSATNANSYKTSAETAASASNTAKLASEAAYGKADTAAKASVDAKDIAVSKATAAEQSATSASTSANTASTKAAEATSAATRAATSETNAAGSASSASTSATNAAKSANSVGGSAEAAAGSASSAATSATNAGNSATAANTAKVAAESARDAAGVSASAASTHASTANTRANNAGTYADAASQSANTASTAAGNALTYRNSAAQSVTDAQGYATASAKDYTAVNSRLNAAGGTGVTVEQALTSAANSITGLQGQYTVKIDNNGYVSGFGLASSYVNGVPTSSFVVLADRFAVALPGHAAKYPFVVGQVGGQTVISLRGDIIADGSFLFRDASGKVLLGIGVPLDPSLAAAGTKNSEVTLSTLGAPAAALSRVAIGTMHSGGSGDVRFVKNQNVNGTANDGEIRVLGTAFYHPDGTKRAITDKREVSTPFEDVTTADPFFIIYTDESPVTRFGTSGFLGVPTAAISPDFFAAVYNLATGVWQAVDNANVRTAFTPLATDCIVAIGRKYTSNASGAGIDMLSSLLSVNTNLPEDGATVGAPAGTLVAGISAANVASAVTNFNAANDRNGAALVIPTLATDGTAIDHTIRKDGGADISFEWSWAGSEGDIDGFLVFVHQRTSSFQYIFGTTPLLETVYTLPASRRAFILFGAAADLYTTVGVMAYRSVDKTVNAAGVIKSPLVVSTASGENPYRPSANVAFAGDITGTISGTAAATVVANATAGKTANDAVAGINTSIAGKLSKAGNDEITGTISLRSQYAMLVGTANDGIFYGSTGIYGRKGGVTQLSVGADGTAYFSGTLGANVVKAGNIEAGAIRASHAAITTSAGNELPDPRFKDLRWWGLEGKNVWVSDWGGQKTGWNDGASLYVAGGPHMETYSQSFALQKGARYRVEIQVNLSPDFTGQFSIFMLILGQAHSSLGQPHLYTWANNGLSVHFDSNSPKGLRNFSMEEFIDPTKATGLAQMMLMGRVDTGTIEFGGIRIIRMSDETLIGPGVVQTKHLVISKGGAVNSGQTGYGKGNGFWIEGAGNGHGARMSLGNETGRQLLCDPNNNVLGLVNADITNPNLQTSFSINMGDIYLTRQANGSLTTGLAVSASGGTAVRYQWSLTIEGGGDLELRGDPTGPGPILYAAGRERWVYGWVTCTAWSSTGASATRSTYIRIQFGTAVET